MQTIPAPPAPPPAPAIITVQTTGQGAVVATPVAQTPVLSYSQLRSRGSELSRQLNSADGRRSELMRDLRRAPESVKPGLEAQIQELSGRIVQIEQDIALNGQQLAIAKVGDAEAGSAVTPTNGLHFVPSGGEITAISIVFTLFVLCPIALAISRAIWKRTTRMGMPQPTSRESDLRLERVEQAVDAIAVEVERISEGQRFVTQLMTQQPALGEGAAQPVRVASNAEPVMASWQQR